MRKNARKLTHEQKIQVVRRLASFDSPTAIIKALQAEYGVTITRSSITYYNPATDHGRLCAQQWKTLFFATRKAVTEGTAEIGAANKMVRVRWLDALVHDAMNEGDAKLAAQLLAQVAKEMGEAYTNRQRLEHTGKDGGPLEVKEVTDRQRARALAALINKARAAPAEPADPAKPDGG